MSKVELETALGRKMEGKKKIFPIAVVLGVVAAVTGIIVKRKK